MMSKDSEIPTPAPPSSTSFSDPLSKPQTLRGRTIALQIVQSMVVLLGMASIVTGIWYISSLIHGQQAEIPLFFMDSLTEHIYFLTAVTYMYGFWILSLIPYSLWVHRANKNCHALGAEGMKHTPGWAVGWTFIPIANVIKPYMILDEIWKTSKNPLDWEKQIGSHVVGWGWLCLIIGGILNRVAGRYMDQVSTYDGYILVAICSTLSVTLFTICGTLLIIYYGKVSKIQTEHMRSIGYF